MSGQWADLVISPYHSNTLVNNYLILPLPPPSVCPWPQRSAEQASAEIRGKRAMRGSTLSYPPGKRPRRCCIWMHLNNSWKATPKSLNSTQPGWFSQMPETRQKTTLTLSPSHSQSTPACWILLQKQCKEDRSLEKGSKGSKASINEYPRKSTLKGARIGVQKWLKGAGGMSVNLLITSWCSELGSMLSNLERGGRREGFFRGWVGSLFWTLTANLC